jgi:hypothetical protein
MRVLFDQGAPAPLRHHLARHQVQTVFERGWSTLRNGDLIHRAEAEGFEVFLTTDRNLRYQQRLSGRRIAIVVLLGTSWPRIQAMTATVAEAIDAATPGSYQELAVPPIG